MLRWLLEPEPPGLGLDLRVGEFSLARLSDKRGKPELSACVTAPLPLDCLSFEMTQPNIVDRDALTQALRDVMAQTTAPKNQRVALTLPDTLSRISVVELPEAPRSSAETLDVLKFSLKRSMPFDASEARIAYERLPGKTPSYLTGIMHESVAVNYEEFLGELGLTVGLVLPASVSLLRMLGPTAARFLPPSADYFFINFERDYFTVCLVRNRDTPVLIRTLGMRVAGQGTAPYTEDDFVQEIIPTAIYYREKLHGTTLSRIYYRSLRPDLENVRELLEEQFETPSEPFDLSAAVASAKDLHADAALLDSVSAAAGAAVGWVA